jgi:predicted cupin superfamily sugar epimerase
MPELYLSLKALPFFTKTKPMMNAEYWINKLGLQSHPEGGYYYETFAANEIVSAKALPERYGGNRKFYTSIYFLLKSGQVSHFHKIKSDEIWAFHAGGPLDIHVIDSSGNYKILKLGLNLEKGEFPQHVVPAGCWFGASLDNSKEFSLVGCFVAPGFDFADFQLATQESLISEFPQYENIIKRLTP